jgi:Zn-dependent protease
MKWAWKITRIAGIDIYVHATFFILIAWVALSYWTIDQNITTVLEGVGFILALFACVVLHEYGHALTARRYGIRTKHITLLPIGGVASLERMPKDPKQEILVALAGPAVNLVIAFILWLLLSVSGSLESMEQLSLTDGSFLQRLMILNLVLAVFNLLQIIQKEFIIFFEMMRD